MVNGEQDKHKRNGKNILLNIKIRMAGKTANKISSIGSLSGRRVGKQHKNILYENEEKRRQACFSSNFFCWKALKFDHLDFCSWGHPRQHLSLLTIQRQLCGLCILTTNLYSRCQRQTVLYRKCWQCIKNKHQDEVCW